MTGHGLVFEEGLLARCRSVAAFVGCTSPVYACSISKCLSPVFAPGQGRSIPANARGLVFYPSLGALVPNPMGVLQLIDPSDAQVASIVTDPTSAREPTFLLPSPPLMSGGSYRFRATSSSIETTLRCRLGHLEDRT